MEDARASTSSQRLARTLNTLLERPQADRTSISVIRDEQLSEGSSGNIPVSLQELVYGGKAAGMGTPDQLVDRNNELLPSIKEVIIPRKDSRLSEGLDTHVCKGKVQEIKAWLKNQSILSEDQKKEKSPVEAPQASTSKNPPQQVSRKGKKAQRARKRQSPSRKSLTFRAPVFQRNKINPWKMCSIWKELLWNSKKGGGKNE
ncbi:hypothetical protein O181_009986 [Austropuccinia psidii MF-1]|uniref:Uncharacterized protein n=1 Tax=Austropuccinia psidii MF-1 TaxID=1389203 RepID=A0A9Q3BSW7_9BASI|nr:hypothetical protein [Austropuccinia psidii MF-1]